MTRRRYTKGVGLCIAAILLTACVVPAIPAQSANGIAPSRPRVLVLPLAATDGDPRLETIALTIRGSLETVLQLVDGYELVSADSEARMGERPGSSGIAEVAEEFGVENVLFGRVGNQGEAIVVELSVYNALEQTVTVNENARADTLFDVFSVTDQLLSDVLEGFSGVRFTFGSIRFTPQGTPNRYTVLVDGQRLGDNISVLQPVPAGIHEVRLRQERPSGSATLFEGEVLVEEDNEANVVFQIPFLTAAERDALLSAEVAVLERYADGTDTAEDYNRYVDTQAPADADGIARFSAWAPGYEGLSSGRQAFLSAVRLPERPADVSVDRGTPDLPGASRRYQDVISVGARLKAMTDNINDAKSVPPGTFTVDGDVSEWTQQRIAVNEVRSGPRDGRRVVDWAVAQDETYLYVRVRYTEPPVTDGENRYRVMLFQDPRNRTDGDIEFGFNYRHDNSKDTDLYVAAGDDWRSPGFTSYGVFTAIDGTDAELRIRLDHLPPSPTLSIRTYIFREHDRTSFETYRLLTVEEMIAR